MAIEHNYHHQPPGLWPLYVKALLPKDKTSAVNPAIPPLAAELTGVGTSNHNLTRYQKVCGFMPRATLPATWPHILGFPLHLKLLTDRTFPLPLLGLVHLRNTITQHRPIGAGEIIDIRVSMNGQQHTERGLEFDLLMAAHSGGRLIWEESSTYLSRQPSAGNQDKSKPKSPQAELVDFPHTLEVSAPESLGRQYGRISGDRNPIHMHALTAKAFGFPRAIAHGMWSKAHCLALLEQQQGWRDGSFSISCSFKKPLFLPGNARLNWRQNDESWDYQLRNERGDAPHLAGEVHWL